MPIPIHINANEFFDSDSNEFISIDETDLILEHSLLSISKWESKWHKPFLSTDVNKTNEELMDYYRCMVTYPDEIDPKVFLFLSREQIKMIGDYIENPMTATVINNRSKRKNREIITSELIYYWMAANQIPFECENWHLNRLLTLIQVCGIKNDPKGSKKMSKREIISENDRINEMRKAKYNTKG